MSGKRAKLILNHRVTKRNALRNSALRCLVTFLVTASAATGWVRAWVLVGRVRLLGGCVGGRGGPGEGGVRRRAVRDSVNAFVVRKIFAKRRPAETFGGPDVH
jgi:hypothetical protein